MADPAILVALSASGLAAAGLLSAAGLKGWTGWLELRRLQLSARRAGHAPPAGGARIELAELRDRVRRLETIAAGGEA